MKQEVEIRGKRLLVMIAVLFIAIYIVLRKGFRNFTKILYYIVGFRNFRNLYT